MKMRKEILTVVFSFILTAVLAIIVSGGAFSPSLNYASVNEDVSNLFNFTINNTDSAENITQVNISLGSMAISVNTNGTSLAGYSLIINSTSASWTNSTNLINANGSVHYFWFNATFRSPGTYNFNITILNTTNALNSSLVQIIVNDTTPLAVQFTNQTPASGNYSENSISANITANGSCANLTICLYNSTFGSNCSVDGNISHFVNFSSLSDGIYYLNATLNDSDGDMNYSETRTIRLDKTKPVITLISPSNGTNQTSSRTVTFRYNVTDASIASCTITHDTSDTDTTITTDSTQEFSRTFDSNGLYDWHIDCTDFAGNTNASVTWRVRVNYTSTSTDDSEEDSGDGGADPGFWTQTYIANENVFKNSTYNASLSVHHRAKFKIGSAYYYVGVVKLSSSEITINASSAANLSYRPQQASMRAGDEKKFDLTNDGYYDIKVFLKAISGSKANMTISPINEKVPATLNITTASSNITTNNTSNITEENQTGIFGAGSKVLSAMKSKWFWIVFGAIVIAAAAAAYYLIFIRKLLFRRSVKVKGKK